MSKMDELIGLFIEDEAANVDVYTRLFALEGLKLDCLDKLPLTVDSYYDIILEKNVDFLSLIFICLIFLPSVISGSVMLFETG